MVNSADDRFTNIAGGNETQKTDKYGLRRNETNPDKKAKILSKKTNFIFKVNALKILV